MQGLITEQGVAQDTEVQHIAEEITDNLQAAFDVLIYRRDRQYADAIEPLDAERVVLEQESASIEEAASSLERIFPAKARIAQYEADQLTVAGKSEEAEAKLEEMRQAEGAPAAMRARQGEIATRIEAIEEEKRACARRIFEVWYSECQSIVRSAERGLFIVLLDGLWNATLDFESRACPQRSLSEAPMVRPGHRIELTAGERTNEWGRGFHWYSGRGQQ